MYSNIASFIAACAAVLAMIFASRLLERKSGVPLFTWKGYRQFAVGTTMGVVGAVAILMFIDIFRPISFFGYRVSLLSNVPSNVGYYFLVLTLLGVFTGSEIASKERKKPNIFGFIFAMLLADFIFAVPYGIYLAHKFHTLLQMYGDLLLFAFFSLMIMPFLFYITDRGWPKTSEIFSEYVFVAICSNVVLLFSITTIVAINII